MRIFIVLTIFITSLHAQHLEVLSNFTGSWEGTSESHAYDSQNKDQPATSTMKTVGSLILNNKVLFRRGYTKRVRPQKDDFESYSFRLMFWLDFKKRYRSISFISTGRVYYSEFTVEKDGKDKLYNYVDGKYEYVGKATRDKTDIAGSSEFMNNGYLIKSSWKIKKVDKVEIAKPEIELDPKIKKVLDAFPGKYPLPGHYKLLEGKDKLTVFGYETKQKKFMKWEIYANGDYKVYDGKGFLEDGKSFWKQVE